MVECLMRSLLLKIYALNTSKFVTFMGIASGKYSLQIWCVIGNYTEMVEHGGTDFKHYITYDAKGCYSVQIMAKRLE